VRVWPLGDSLTVGGYGDQVNFSDSYRQALYRQLGGASRVEFRGHLTGWGNVRPDAETSDFSHSGTGGATVQDTIQIAGWVAPGIAPDVIVLNIGTNGGTPAEYQQLVSRLTQLAPNAWIVLSTLTPRRPELNGRQAIGFRNDLNNTIRAIGNASFSDRLLTAEVFNRMLNEQGINNGDFVDDTHMAISGGTKFAQALLPEVSQAVQAARRC
jgi:lysophospholipase L1-like esterase